MTDIVETFYLAWETTMGSVPHQILCSWKFLIKLGNKIYTRLLDFSKKKIISGMEIIKNASDNT